MGKKVIVETTLIRVSLASKNMVNEVQKIVAVESKGETLNKIRALEVALEEFLDKRKGDRNYEIYK